LPGQLLKLPGLLPGFRQSIAEQFELVQVLFQGLQAAQGVLEGFVLFRRREEKRPAFGDSAKLVQFLQGLACVRQQGAEFCLHTKVEQDAVPDSPDFLILLSRLPQQSAVMVLPRCRGISLDAQQGLAGVLAVFPDRGDGLAQPEMLGQNILEDSRRSGAIDLQFAPAFGREDGLLLPQRRMLDPAIIPDPQA
jgi:hypothetical protein